MFRLAANAPKATMDQNTKTGALCRFLDLDLVKFDAWTCANGSKGNYESDFSASLDAALSHSQDSDARQNAKDRSLHHRSTPRSREIGCFDLREWLQRNYGARFPSHFQNSDARRNAKRGSPQHFSQPRSCEIGIMDLREWLKRQLVVPEYVSIRGTKVSENKMWVVYCGGTLIYTRTRRLGA